MRGRRSRVSAILDQFAIGAADVHSAAAYAVLQHHGYRLEYAFADHPVALASVNLAVDLLGELIPMQVLLVYVCLSG